MKKLLPISLSIVLSVSSLVSASALDYGEEYQNYNHTSTVSYTDVSSTHWAYDAIQRATEKNWFSGYPDGRFVPNGSITRAEALKVFVTFLGLELSEVKTSSFYDVEANKWYAPYIEAGKELFPTHTNIQGKNAFQPDMPVTREDTIYALVKALGYDVNAKFIDESTLNMFSDQNSISSNIKPYFSIALKNQLVSGFDDGTIRAQDSLTRAEFATLLYRGSFVGHSDAYVAKISSVEVMPASPVEIQIGESVTLSARATYTDGTNQNYTDLQPFDSTSSGAISLNGLTIKGEKEGTATIKYNSSYLKDKSLVVNVKNPTDEPKIKITDYPEETSESRVTIGGLVIDKNPAKVDFTCNGKDIILGEDGSFSTIVSLKPGENAITFNATNEYKLTGTKTINVIRTSAPSIFVSRYKPRTYAKTTPVEGVITDSDLSSVRLTCNGLGVDIRSDGTFATQVDLNIVGDNLITFSAVNKYDKTANQPITIERMVSDEEVTEPDKVDDPIIPDSPEKVKGKVQIAFVIDSTGSMYDEIGNVKTNITEFTKHLASLGVDDLKMSVVDYKDITCDGEDSTVLHRAGGSPWHTTPDEVISSLDTIVADGGGDIPETVLDAFGCVLDNTNMDWSADAYKFVVLLTDADYKTDNRFGISSLDYVADKLSGSNVYTSVISSPSYYDTYRVLTDKTGGKTTDITSQFNEILSSFSDDIIKISVGE